MAIDREQRRQTIVVEPGADLAEILDRAYDSPVVLERDGIRYHITRDPLTPVSRFDADAFDTAARALGETLRAGGVDFDRWKRDIRYDRGHDDAYDRPEPD